MILHTIYANTCWMAGSQKRLTCFQRNYFCNKCTAEIRVRVLDVTYNCNIRNRRTSRQSLAYRVYHPFILTPYEDQNKNGQVRACLWGGMKIGIFCPPYFMHYVQSSISKMNSEKRTLITWYDSIDNRF
jgi:hypothetical protein